MGRSFTGSKTKSEKVNLTEQALIIKGCTQNDRVSQEKLYMQMYPALRNLCQRFFDDEHEIITAINNGMLRAFKNIEQYDVAKSELPTWIYAIVRNETLTLIRNKKTAGSTEMLLENVAAETFVSPFDKTNGIEVYAYLTRLPATTRAVFNLFYLEEYSIREVGAALSMKEGTVKWHLSEGRKKLQSFFKTGTLKRNKEAL